MGDRLNQYRQQFRHEQIGHYHLGPTNPALASDCCLAVTYLFGTGSDKQPASAPLWKPRG